MATPPKTADVLWKNLQKLWIRVWVDSSGPWFLWISDLWTCLLAKLFWGAKMPKTRVPWCANAASFLTWRISQAVHAWQEDLKRLPVESCVLMCLDLCREMSAQNQMFLAMWLCEESTHLEWRHLLSPKEQSHVRNGFYLLRFYDTAFLHKMIGLSLIQNPMTPVTVMWLQWQASLSGRASAALLSFSEWGQILRSFERSCCQPIIAQKTCLP